MKILKNYIKPLNYKYYNYFMTRKGDFVIWSRDNKRFYIDRTSLSRVSVPDKPFKSITLARNYLKRMVD